MAWSEEARQAALEARRASAAAKIATAKAEHTGKSEDHKKALDAHSTAIEKHDRAGEMKDSERQEKTGKSPNPRADDPHEAAHEFHEHMMSLHSNHIESMEADPKQTFEQTKRAYLENFDTGDRVHDMIKVKGGEKADKHEGGSAKIAEQMFGKKAQYEHAAKEANEASKTAETAEDHRNAQSLHNKAAGLDVKNHDMHSQKANFHGEQSLKLYAKSAKGKKVLAKLKKQ